MPLVFVHGVANRKGPEYDAAVATRELFLRRYVFSSYPGGGAGVKVFQPYWGGDAATFHWDHGSIPEGSYASLGPAEDAAWRAATYLAEIDPKTPADQAVTAIARYYGLSAGVDVLFAVALSPDARPQDRDAIVSIAPELSSYAEANPAPPWLKAVRNDQEFVSELRKYAAPAPAAGPPAAGGHVSLGALDNLWDKLKESADRIAGSPGAAASSMVMAAARRKVHMAGATFLGDVFVYLQKCGAKGSPGPIPQIVIAALNAAAPLTTPDDPLIAVGHSMGGDILYDILTHFRPDIRVDLLITVGSQVAVFEELKLFKSSNPAIPSATVAKVPRPANVARWINIFDANDPFGFAASKVFSDVEDFAYDTGKGLMGAHGEYFLRPSFYERLKKRL